MSADETKVGHGFEGPANPFAQPPTEDSCFKVVWRAGGYAVCRLPRSAHPGEPVEMKWGCHCGGVGPTATTVLCKPGCPNETPVKPAGIAEPKPHRAQGHDFDDGGHPESVYCWRFVDALERCGSRREDHTEAGMRSSVRGWRVIGGREEPHAGSPLCLQAHPKWVSPNGACGQCRQFGWNSERDRLKAENARLEAERDQARRIWQSADRLLGAIERWTDQQWPGARQPGYLPLPVIQSRLSELTTENESLRAACASADAGISDWRLGCDIPDRGDMRYLRAAEPYLIAVQSVLRGALAPSESRKEEK